MPFPVRVAGGEAIASSWGNNVVDSLPVIGVIEAFAGDTAPVNWLLCRGQAVSRASYPALFTMVAVRFGAGDGTTTFNLPDMRGRYPIGFNQGGSWFALGVGERYGTKDANLPAHQHGGINHLHAASLGGSATMNWGEVWQSTAEPADNVNVFSVRIGDGITINIGKFPSSNYPGPASVGGMTSGADRDLTTGWAGGDANNANLPPSMSLNFIIRVT